MIHQYADKQMHPLYWWCIEQLKGKLPKEVEYECVEENPFKQWEHIADKRLRSDPMRFEWMALPGDNAWLDADSICIEWPDFSKCKKDKPYIMQLDNGAFECGVMFFHEGNQWFALEALDRFAKMTYKGPGWHYKVLKEMKNDIYPLPDEQFFRMLCLSTIIHSRADQIGNKNFSAVRNAFGQFVFNHVTGIL